MWPDLRSTPLTRVAGLIAAWAIASGLLLAVDAARAAADSTAPVITRTIAGFSGEDGWYRGPVNIRWTVEEPESLWTSTGCDARALTAETAGEPFECRAVSAGGSTSNGLTVKIDSTPPVATAATPDRPADRAGWHNHPVTVAFAGVDGLSGVSSCSSVTYAGPIRLRFR